MGLGICVTASLGKRPPSKLKLFDAITARIAALVTEPLLSRAIRTGSYQHTLEVVLHPLGEALAFTWEPPGKLTAMTKTSTVGPGFHAWVTDLLRALEPELGLTWDWSDDETAFARDGDFKALQDEMLTWLVAVGSSLTQHDGTNFAINMPLGSLGMPDAFSCTPLGPRSLKWWQAVRDRANLEDAALDFFPWWNRPFDARAKHQLGLGLLWCEVRWRPPDSKAEEEMARTALAALESAARDDPTLGVPAAEMNELAEMIDFDEDVLARPARPAQGGLGYHRFSQRRDAQGHWTLVIPGYFYEDFTEESGVLTFSYGDRNIHMTAFSVNDKRGRPLAAAKLLAEATSEITEPFTHEFAADGHVGKAFFTSIEEDDWSGIGLMAWVARDGHFVHLTLAFEQEADRAWALDVWRSVRHTPPADPAP